MAKVQIRSVKASDISSIIPEWNHCVPYDQRDEDFFPETFIPDKKIGTALVAVAEEKLVGFVCLFGEEIRGLFVSEEWRRQGIATKLLNRALNQAKSKGKKRVHFATTNWWNWVPGIDSKYQEALAFFKAMGFRVGKTLADVDLNFSVLDDMKKVKQVRANTKKAGVEITPYNPSMLPTMKEFVKTLNMSGWPGQGWEESYAIDSKNVRFVAIKDSKIIGWVDSLVSPNGQSGINFIAVLPDVRHKGIGSGLLWEAALTLRESGGTSGFAGYVPAPFYLANGWQICREYISIHQNLK